MPIASTLTRVVGPKGTSLFINGECVYGDPGMYGTATNWTIDTEKAMKGLNEAKKSADAGFVVWCGQLRLAMVKRGYTHHAISTMNADDWRQYHADGLSPTQAIDADEAHA